MTAYTGNAVRRARRSWARKLYAAGQLPCWRCGLPIRARPTLAQTYADTAWHVGHLVDRSAGGDPGLTNTAPEHAHGVPGLPGRCAGNLSNGAAIVTRRARRLRTTTWETP